MALPLRARWLAHVMASTEATTLSEPTLPSEHARFASNTLMAHGFMSKRMVTDIGMICSDRGDFLI